MGQPAVTFSQALGPTELPPAQAPPGEPPGWKILLKVGLETEVPAGCFILDCLPLQKKKGGATPIPGPSSFC